MRRGGRARLRSLPSGEFRHGDDLRVSTSGSVADQAVGESRGEVVLFSLAGNFDGNDC